MFRRSIFFILCLVIASGQIVTSSSPPVDIHQIEQTQFQISQSVLGSTFIGGSGSDDAYCLAIDDAGNFYIVGRTASADFPTVNPAYASHSGSTDVFVMKINSAGTQIIYSTFIGGDGNDIPQSCVLDDSGNVYVTGLTDSSDFPSINELNSTSNGSFDVFIFKLKADGSALDYSTYLGGPQYDQGTSIAVDQSGNVIVCGTTESSSFPTKNAIDDTFGGSADCFVLKLNATGNGILFSTFIGGSAVEKPESKIDISNEYIYMSGSTDSDDFITTPGCFDNSFNGGTEGFILRMPLDGSSLNYSTYFGGTNDDFVELISLDSSGNVVIAGKTVSDNLPMVNSYDSSKNTFFDVFIAKLDISLTGFPSLIYSTYFGGNDNDYGHDMFLDDDDNIFLCGQTSSTNMDLVKEFDDTQQGIEGFILSLSSDGSDLLFSSYIGGSNDDWVYGVYSSSVDIIGLVGTTESSDFYTYNALYDTLNGSSDAFFYRFDSNPVTTTTPTDTTTTTTTTPSSPDDADGDGLSDDDEINIYGTDPNNVDTDSDGCPDGWEVARGLDPLEWTNATGEAQEHLMTAIVPTAGGFAITLIVLIATGFIGLNIGILKKLRSRILLLPAIVFLVMFLVFVPVTVYGSEDPGSNIASRSSSDGSVSFDFDVLESPWWTSNITITASYRAQYVDTYMTVYVTISQGTTEVGEYELYLSGGYVDQLKTKSVEITLAPGTYQVSRTYTYLDIFNDPVGPRSVTVEVVQGEDDGRNLDQIQWPAMRNIFLFAGVGLTVLGIFVNTEFVNTRFGSKVAEVPIEQDVG